MKEFLTTFIMLLTFLLPSVVWGSVDGKGVFCNDDPYDEGYIFEKGKVTLISIKRINEKVILDELEGLEYGTDQHSIVWSLVSTHDSIRNRSGMYNLNRKTLRLKFLRGGKVGEIQCEVYTSSQIMRMMESQRKTIQSEYSDSIKDNKI